MHIDIAPATTDDAGELAALFDAYRTFYERPPDPDGARRFVAARLRDGSTRFFIGRGDGVAAGFVHLLPTVDTLGMRPAWILEDLFVRPEMRRGGLGSALLARAESFARHAGAARISLTTAHGNVAAQRLYAAHGYQLDTEFRTFHRTLARGTSSRE